MSARHQTLIGLYTSGWHANINNMDAKTCVACVASILPSVIEALDEDECAPELFTVIVGTYYYFSLNGYYYLPIPFFRWLLTNMTVLLLDGKGH